MRLFPHPFIRLPFPHASTSCSPVVACRPSCRKSCQIEICNEENWKMDEKMSARRKNTHKSSLKAPFFILFFSLFPFIHFAPYILPLTRPLSDEINKNVSTIYLWKVCTFAIFWCMNLLPNNPYYRQFQYCIIDMDMCIPLPFRFHLLGETHRPISPFPLWPHITSPFASGWLPVSRSLVGCMFHMGHNI